LTESVFYLHETLDKYLHDLSARRIIPGGGSAAAAAAALGAGLNLMVINYSIKEDSDGVEDKGLIVLKAKQEEFLSRISALIDEDCRVFSDLMRSLSSGEDAEGKYIQAAEVPMDICRECCETMEITAVLSGNCSKNLLTDVGCAGHIIKAAFHSAELNVFINLKHIKDKGFARKAREELDGMCGKIEGMSVEIIGRVEKDLM